MKVISKLWICNNDELSLKRCFRTLRIFVGCLGNFCNVQLKYVGCHFLPALWFRSLHFTTKDDSRHIERILIIFFYLCECACVVCPFWLFHYLHIEFLDIAQNRIYRNNVSGIFCSSVRWMCGGRGNNSGRGQKINKVELQILRSSGV